MMENNGKCKNCKYTGYVLKDTHDCCPSCLMNKIDLSYDYLSDEDYAYEYEAETGIKLADKVVGNSAEVKGELTIKSKDGAIQVIIGLMETFNISTDELDF